MLKNRNAYLDICWKYVFCFVLALVVFFSVIQNHLAARTVQYTRLFRSESELSYNNGYSIAAAGDVNFDGVTDIIQGEHFDNFGQNDGGEAYVYSGATGEVIHYFGRVPYHSYFGEYVGGVGDVNADGFDDVAVSALGDLTPGNDFVSSKVLVYSGATGEVLHLLEAKAVWIAKVGDVDKDGYDDILTRTGSLNPITNVFSGATGQPLFSFEQLYLQNGDLVQDIDGDNVSESIVGSYSNAKIVSSIDGSVLFSLPDYKQYYRGAFDAGDLNGDTIPDLVLAEGGKVDFISGVDETIIHTTAFSSLSISGVGDINNDGFIDLLIGNASEDWTYLDGEGPNAQLETQEEAGSARIYSGYDGAVLHSSFGRSFSRYGSDVGSLGDLNGDGVIDFYVGANGDQSSRSFFDVYVSEVIPEPSTFTLIGVGLISFLSHSRARRNAMVTLSKKADRQILTADRSFFRVPLSAQMRILKG